MFVFLGIALLVSIVLAFFVVQVSMSMKKYQADLVIQRDKIKKLIEEKPAPLKGNLEAINSDLAMVQQKVNDIHLIFGKPYRTSIQAFADALEINENTLYSKWRTAYEKGKKLGSNEAIFLSFMKEFDEQKIENAVNAFKNTIEPRTVEDLGQANLVNLIMEGLGLPRTMSPEACTTYISNMDLKLTNLLKPREGENCPAILVPDKSALFSIYKGMPPAENIGLILKHYKLLEDLILRMKESNIKEIKSLGKTELLGVEGKGFLTLTYKMQIVGSMDSIKSFVNNLQDAYKQNVVYIVKDFAIKKLVDEAKNLQSATPAVDKRPAPVVPGEKAAKKEKEDDTYGAAVIGGSTDVIADIKIDYVIYVADEIKKTK
ncbi:MAG TPA: hypothetical protein DET40_05905 [Lentisphaeria bacterium]|nr:MAG: hypothetical protein A2X45_04410 [Lentisphaerae bacterium GWF2_50_93]HCE43062.1 hypothetical protein [Lentisphaeria bacterium]